MKFTFSGHWNVIHISLLQQSAVLLRTINSNFLPLKNTTFGVPWGNFKNGVWNTIFGMFQICINFFDSQLEMYSLVCLIPFITNVFLLQAFVALCWFLSLPAVCSVESRHIEFLTIFLHFSKIKQSKKPRLYSKNTKHNCTLIHRT